MLCSGRRLLTLINDILDASSIRQGKLAVQAAPVDIADVAEEVARIHQLMARGAVVAPCCAAADADAGLRRLQASAYCACCLFLLLCASLRRLAGWLTPPCSFAGLRNSSVRRCLTTASSRRPAPQPQMKPGVSLVVDVQPNLPPVIGDRARIVQIAHNLLSNASKFTESGTVALRVREAPPGGGAAGGSASVSVELSVSDTGIGIPPDKLETVWEPFRQVDESITRRFGGNGLGLAIVRDLVLAQNGACGPPSCLRPAQRAARHGRLEEELLPPKTLLLRRVWFHSGFLKALLLRHSSLLLLLLLSFVWLLLVHRDCSC